MKDLDDLVLSWMGDFSCYSNIEKDVVKALREYRVVKFQDSAGRPSGPTAFQFEIPLSASVISSMDGSSSSHRLGARGGKRYMIVGSVSGSSGSSDCGNTPPIVHQFAPYPV